jgi:hypothetical protein
MKFIEIVQIKESLKKLSQERLHVAYEIAKNIRICDKIINETQEIAKELYTKYADVDTNGQVITSRDEEGRETAKISDPEKIKECQEELTKLDREEHDVQFCKINKTKLEAEKLSADILIPLVDVIIIE